MAGKPLRSTGRLNVTQFAVEAGVARWRLTHQHVDLKEMFQAHVRNQGLTPAPFRGTAAASDDLQDAHRALQAHCAELEQRITLYGHVIQLLSFDGARGEHVTPSGNQYRFASDTAALGELRGLGSVVPDYVEGDTPSQNSMPFPPICCPAPHTKGACHAQCLGARPPSEGTE